MADNTSRQKRRHLATPPLTINWFPGHMAVAVDKIRKAMADHDVVIEVLDARCPMASANPLVESLRLHRQRPCLKVLNKADAADPAVTPQWLGVFKGAKKGGGGAPTPPCRRSGWRFSTRRKTCGPSPSPQKSPATPRKSSPPPKNWRRTATTI